MIHKSATLIGEMVFHNGAVNALFVSINHNIGTPIVWQRVTYPSGKRKTMRVTGGNISKLSAALNDAIKQKEMAWKGNVNQPALDWLLAA